MDTADLDLEYAQRRSFLAGAGACLIAVLGLYVRPARFFQAYLFSYLFWLSLPIGSLGLLMLHHLTGGRWSLPLARLFEAAVWTLPLMTVLFVPIALGLEHIYPWAVSHPDHTVREITEAAIEEKRGYLNVTFFLLRAAGYFVIWIGTAWMLRRWSRQLDESFDAATMRRLRRWSGPGLVVFVITWSFASIDWMMSLEPAWFSSIYGWMVLSGATLEALLFGTLVLYGLRKRSPFDRVLTQQHYHDLGNLILVFLCLWVYMQVMQLVIIWSGNLPEEIVWYLRRSTGGWLWVSGLLAIFHFVVPFFLLLNRERKRNARRLARLAGYLLAVRLLAVYWMIKPSFAVEGWSLHWLDAAHLVGIGGIWLGTFMYVLGRRPLIPTRHPGVSRVVGGKPESTE